MGLWGVVLAVLGVFVFLALFSVVASLLKVLVPVLLVAAVVWFVVRLARRVA